MLDINTLCSKRNMGKQSQKSSHKCASLADRKRTGKCSFTKVAGVKVPFHQNVEGGRGMGGHTELPENIFWKPKGD